MPAPGVADQGRSPVPHTIPESCRRFSVEEIPRTRKRAFSLSESQRRKAILATASLVAQIGDQEDGMYRDRITRHSELTSMLAANVLPSESRCRKVLVVQLAGNEFVRLAA